MKKYCVTILAVLLVLNIFAGVFCLVGFAAQETASNVHLVAPVSVEYGDGKLFVADNITDERGVVHIFDVLGNSPQFLKTEEFDFVVSKLRFFNGKLFVLHAQGFLEYTISDGNRQYSSKRIFDVAQTEINKTYFLMQGGVYLNNNTDASILDENNQIVGLCVTQNVFLNVLRKDSFIRYNTTDATSTAWQAVFGSEEFFDCISDGQAAIFVNKQRLVKDGAEILTADTVGGEFYDAAATSSKLYVLSSNNQVLKFSHTSSGYVLDSGFAIGSDVVQIEPPALTQLTSFSLVKSNGYPSNIVYKTTDPARSVPQLLDDIVEQSYIVLGYENDQNHDYYYVFIEGKFGWVKKSGASLKTDPKMSILDTSLNDTANFSAKLMSAGAVYVYFLPYAASDVAEVSYTFNQTSTNMQEVNLLQQFDSDGQMWYFVSFVHQGENKIGFVKRGDVGSIFSTSGSGKTKLVAQMKINASLSENVNVFLTEGLFSDQITVDADTGEKVTLKTGTKVNVLKQTETSSYLQIVYQDGKTYFGWVANRYLIEKDQLTTNALVGIILTGVALVTATALFVVLKTKKKRFVNESVVLEEE